MTSLLKKNPNISDIVRSLNDCAQIIADSHFAETYTRRSLIIPLAEKSLIEPLKDTKRDQYLFGDKLSSLVTNSKGIKKTGNMIQAGNLNWRRQPNRERYKNQQMSNRPSGQRTSQYLNSNRRRYPYPPPPPPPGRRAVPQLPPPPPPPPPGRRQLAQATNVPRRQPYNRPPQL
ncbi:formin-like protein 4 [Plutella xylostella]|uniref:formin-like protein 4 n=1 Tax=Plutella xylostella TaxID=51655 RepID=UPI0020331A9E|nr:formin-like protein 4 [Plutella xylostella]